MGRSAHLQYAELSLIKATGWVVILLGFAATGLIWAWAPAIQWLLQTGIVWWFVIYATASRLDLNRADSAAVPYANLGWANRLTILRGWLVAATAGFLFQHWPPALLMWVPGSLYLMAAVLDRIDGYVARRSGQTSMLGVELDTVFDALGLAIAPLLAVWYGQIHWSYLLFSSAYYLFQWGIYRRKQHGLPVHSLPPNRLRRAWAGFQMGFIAIVLLPLFGPPVTVIAGVAFMLPVLIGFTIDWLIVSGHIDRQHAATASLFNAIESIGQAILLPGLRVVLIISLLSSLHYPLTLFGLVVLLIAGMILAGLAGRVFALVLILLLGWHYQTESFGLNAYILISSTVWVMLLGTGRYSLLRHDEDWVNRYDGA